MVQKGSFREDLYYRLNVVNIETPPLRDHKSDIPYLAQNFLRKYASEYAKPKIQFTEKALELLERYNWPGNVRELENVIQRAIIMSEQTIDIGELPDHLKYPIPNSNSTSKSLQEVEKEHILKVMASVENNKTKAAEILQIDRKTLRNKLK